ncbi:MAG: hypothetical protein HYX92_10335 [Chloroflexi bacterium]|nr:hypothetical protein [Chloroflexota bacterium]
MSTDDTIKAPDSLDEINDLFCQERLTDGLPIVPPTRERVEAMVRASRRDPQELIGIVPPRQGAATVEKVAINAVMAGCLPEYLPVVLAAVEAILEEGFNLYGIQTTTNPVTPLFLVNGPIAKKLKINSSYNCLAEGYRANVTIGRAVRLVMINIGGGIAGDTVRATQGQPAKLGLCFAEREEESPWAPFHADRGFDSDSSTVTAFNGGGTFNIRPYATTGREFLAGIARMMALGSSPRHGNALIIICPEHARVIAREGYSKEDVKRYIFDNARIKPSGFTKEVGQSIIDEQVMAWMDVRNLIGELGMETFIPALDRPEEVSVVVAGGAGGHCVYVPGIFPQPTPVVTKVVR